MTAERKIAPGQLERAVDGFASSIADLGPVLERAGSMFIERMREAQDRMLADITRRFWLSPYRLRTDWLMRWEGNVEAATAPLSQFRGTVLGLLHDIRLQPFDLFLRGILADRIEDEGGCGYATEQDRQVARSVRIFQEKVEMLPRCYATPAAEWYKVYGKHASDLHRLTAEEITLNDAIAADAALAFPHHAPRFKARCGLPYWFAGTWETVFYSALNAVRRFPITWFRIEGSHPASIRPGLARRRSYVWQPDDTTVAPNRVLRDVHSHLTRLAHAESLTLWGGERCPQFASIKDAHTALGRAVTDAVRVVAGLQTLYTIATKPDLALEG